MPVSDVDVTIYIILVLYKSEPADSVTYRSLLRSLAEPMQHRAAYRILLYDNTPSLHHAPELPDHVEYLASPANKGLAEPYNLAIAKARAGNFDWLLTLDQDTELPRDFIRELVEVAIVCKQRPQIAAIVPHLSAGGREVSPNWFAAGMFPRWFPNGYHGVPDKPVYAFNSGALLRVSALEEVGGYSPLFWLDNCDTYLFRQMEKNRWKVFVAGKIHLQHNFSMLDIRNHMSLSRYRNSIEAGSAFFDLEMGTLAGIEHTVRLLRRYLRQVVLREDRNVRRITGSMLLQRLLLSRQRRIRTWTEEQQTRMARSRECDA